MDRVLDILVLFPLLLLLLHPSSSYPLCTNSWAPITPKTQLTFCSYNGSSCCDYYKDSKLQKKFLSMNISDHACASLMKSILCASCDPFSAELFTIDSGTRSVPVLCNSTVSKGSYQSNTANDFSGTVWDTCNNVTMLNSPFASSIQGSARKKTSSHTSSKLSTFSSSKNEFSSVFGGSSGNDSVCFNGEPVSFKNTEIQPVPDGLCLEKIGNGSYINLAPHPDGSNRIFLSDLNGRIWLTSVPDVGSGGTLELDQLNPFLDISNIVYSGTDYGMMGMAFHPNFVNNGRFFVSFNCDKTQWPGCTGECSCNTQSKCDPSHLGFDSGSGPCQFYSIVSEFTANSTSTTQTLSLLEERGNPTEVRRIFSMGLPFEAHHGGQILFGPTDGYLYFMMGDGGKDDDPYNFAQNKQALLGKIMRLDVDNFPSAEEITSLGLWGNYSIPKDNPVYQDPTLLPEIWALGFRNPWRCSFDAIRPSYFLCSDDGVNRYEEVNIITKGGNYGWRVYEGPYTFNPPSPEPGGITAASSINAIFPVMGFHFSEVNQNDGSAAIMAGYFYRSMTEPTLYGRFLYADFYGNDMFVGTETPENSGNFTYNHTAFGCADDSPMDCGFTGGVPALGYIFSFGEDNKKDVSVLTSNGVFRVVQRSRCNNAFSRSIDVGIPAPSPSHISSSGTQLRRQPFDLGALFFLLLIMLESGSTQSMLGVEMKGTRKVLLYVAQP
ncbi:hypothetical protein NE237_010181 [Protea cynaroides]|uniref:Glucose/Sorbosone dehydrogenase domain-containing protein n=1 Tax=Protea cynaroides TaxID=273540 RepID=A0A9Q0L030_9MAGN|nr:hypothetical protein NE237_010181 [Protea cynaroides]